MDDTQKKYLTFFIVIAATAVAGFFGIGYLKDVRDDSVYFTQINQIKEGSGVKDITDFHDRMDHLRVFINANSQHKEDEEFRASWRDRTKLAANFIDHLEKRRQDLPHMECSTRASLMGAILTSEGYKIRSIDVYHPLPSGLLSGHALLDVFNPHTKKWESQDPEYDVYWKNKKTGERVSMAEAGLDLENIQPCNLKRCGWGVKSREGATGDALKNLTSYVTTIDRNADERITFYRPDIKPDATMEYSGKKGTYCDVLGKNCKDGFLPATKDNLEKVMD
jgi:hypothetical protein